jgi:hypothetical protein
VGCLAGGLAGPFAVQQARLCDEIPIAYRIYLHADMALKERAIARTTSPGTPAGRYQPPDELLAFLSHL